MTPVPREHAPTPREKLLIDAIVATTGERNRTYGNPKPHFEEIAQLLTGLGFRRDTRKLTASDIAHIMLAVKLVRLHTSPDHTDSYLDIAGYAACGYEAVQK